MKSCKPIEVLLYKHPLKTERESVKVERNTFRKIYEELDLEWAIEDYIILDGDEIVKDYSQVPSSEEICIKCIPKGGGGAFASEGTGMKLVGGALAAIGVAAAVFTGGASLWLTYAGISLATSGLVTIGYGVYLYNYDLDSSSYSTSSTVSNSPSISGSSNSTNQGGRVPVLLGRHLVYPFIASEVFTSSIAGKASPSRSLTKSSGDQYLHMLLCSGYSAMEIDEDTLQFGDVPITGYTGVSHDVNSATSESSSSNIYYPVRVVQDNVGMELCNPEFGTSERYYDVAVTRTTPKNTSSIEVTILFPNGLYFVKDNGDKQFSNEYFYLEWKDVDAPDSAYEIFGANKNVSGKDKLMFVGEYVFSARAVVSYTFSTPNADKQYTIRVSKPTAISDNDINQKVSTAYFESLRSYTESSSGNTDPINSSIKADLNVTSWKVKATDQLSSVIEDVNYEATAYSRVYTGSGSGPDQWVTGLSSNPAVSFLKVLLDPHINKEPISSSDESSKIDWAALEDWYIFCEDKGFECNAYEVGDTTVNAVLGNICSTAMASWNIIDNKYTIIIDTYREDIIQYFTTRNSSDFSGAKAFNDVPTCLTMGFIDKDNGYIEAERYVYNDDYDGDPRSTDVVETLALYGAMGAEQAWKLGRYTHAVTRLRPEYFTFTTDIEYIMCTRGDRIKLNHDVPMFGLTSSRISTVLQSGGETLGFVSDELFQFEADKDYGVTIRLQDGSSIEKSVMNPAVDTTSIIFETTITGEDVLFDDDLVLFGEQGSKDVDLLVQKIEPNGELGATITCTEYNEEIYSADSGTIPAYDAKISKGGSAIINVGELPETQEYKVAQAQQIVALTDQITYSMNASYPDSIQSTTVKGWNPSTFDDFNYIYVNYDDGSKIYKKTLLGPENGVAINSVSSRYPYVMGDYIYYINQEDAGKIYQKGLNDTNDGVAFTTNAVDSFIVDIDSEDIYYINPIDNNYIYIIEEGTSGNGVLFKDVSASHIGMVGGTFFYTATQDSFIYTFDIIDTTDITAYYTIDTVHEFYISQTGYVYYLKDEGMVVYRKSASTLGIPDNEGDPVYGAATGFGITYNGDVIFHSADFDGYLFVGLSNVAIQNATLESEATAFSLTGSIILGSDVITGISADDLDQIVVKDRLVGSGIPNGTYVLMKGNNFIYMTNPATATLGDTAIQVYGSRITLNANRVIIPGTVTAELLEASAINSKAKTTGGFHISEFDLDTGDITIRKPDDSIAFEFDASTGDAIFSGDLSAAGGTFSGDLSITADDESRQIDVGSKGLLVKDAAGVVIHDLPDASIISGYSYAGHLLFADINIAATPIIYSHSSLGFPKKVWTTIQCNTYGNTNIKAVLLNISLTESGSGSGNYSGYRASFRPYGTTWNPTNPSPTVGAYTGFDIGDPLFAYWQMSSPLILPVGTDNKIQFYADAGSATVPTISIAQMGVFI